MSNDRNVPALERAYHLLATLLNSPRPLGISALARELALSKSTVHSLAHTLAHLGLLEQEDEDGRGFRPARPLLALWRDGLLRGPLARAARPLLSTFSQAHDLTAMVGVFLSGRVLVVDAVVAPGFGLAAYAGQVLPSWAGALGKVLLASLPPRQAQVLARKMSAHSPLDQRAYLAEVERTRKTGVARDRGEYLEGVAALAAAVPSFGPQRPLAAVWAVGLAPSLDQERMEALVPEVKALAAEVGRGAAELEPREP